jgi:signal transduction histidine kinase
VHHQAEQANHLSVAWEGPDIPLDVIPGKYLSPWNTEPATVSSVPIGQPNADTDRGSILREVWDNVTIDATEVLTAPRVFDSVLSATGISVVVLGVGRMPEPLEVHLGQAFEERDNFRWCTVEGSVNFITQAGEELTLELYDRGHRVQAILPGWHQDIPNNLRGRTVRVTGVGEFLWQDSTTRAVGRVWLRPSNAITVTNQTPEPEFSRPTTISEIIYANPALSSDSAVRLVGRITRQEGNNIVISDKGTFATFTSVDGVDWRPIGTRIEVPMTEKVLLGLAVNSRVTTKASRAIFTNVTGLSTSPKVIDIGGATNRNGNCEVSNRQFVVDGVGSDIWDSPDQFTFVYEELIGSGSIVTRLDSFDPADPAALAGIMIREGIAPDAQFVDLVRTAEPRDAITSMQWRGRMRGSGNRYINDSAPQTSLPLWLKLERRFNTLPVTTKEAANLTVGDTVEVVGYVTMKDGHPEISAASLTRQREAEETSPATPWRPLVEIARLGDGERRWGGLDYFRFRGVVTFCGDVLGRRYWSIQDGSAATLLSGRTPSNLFLTKPGSYVEVVSNPGWFEPTNTLLADNLFQLGTAAYPEPVRHPGELLLPKRGEGTWIELEGTVRSSPGSGLLEVKSRGEIFTVAVPGLQIERLRGLVDADIRVRGVIVYPNERERLLLVPSPESLEIAKEAAKDPFACALESPRTLSAEALINRSQHRTRLRGVVTYADHGTIYLQEDGGGIKVELESSSSVDVGSTIEIAGFPDLGDDECVVIRHALMKNLPTVRKVVPVFVSPAEAASGRFAGQLVRIRAVVAKSLGATDEGPIELEADQRIFRIGLPGGRAAFGAIPKGSLVEVTGVNVKEAGLPQWMHTSSPSSSILPVKLLLRGVADISVVQKPSWWVVKRALIIISAVGFLSLIVILWIQKLRRRVAQRTAELKATMKKLEEEARRSATLAERDRLAGEIHDSLEQGLNGLILQMESTANLDSCAPEIRSGLKLACNMASFSRTEVQYAVWELQSPMLADSELPVAVEKIMSQIAPESVECTVKMLGASRRLPSDVEHHLLRVVQEAVNNTVKHAAARHVCVELIYEANSVVLSITDDGKGFVPEQVRTGGLGHFGLRSLRSRVGKISGNLEIVSSPAKGTTIRVRVPISES